MKNTFLFLGLTFIFFSCGNDKPEVNADSLRTDSALKTQAANPPIINRSKDSLTMLALPPVMEGDIVFQNDSSAQCLSFGKATKSKYNNMGIIFIRPKDHLYIVLEANDSVHIKPLTEWVDGGMGHHVALMRLKNSNMYLTEKKTMKLKMAAKSVVHKKNDHYFSWSDDEMYCSEMVWKAYHSALNIDLSTPEKLRDFDLTDPLVKQQMKSKYGGNIPKDEQVVSPDDIFHSQHLALIYEH